MTHQQAQKLIELNQHLIGKTLKGVTIDEIIAFPTDSEAFKEFVKIYIDSLDAEKAITPFIHYDLDVFCVVDKGRIRAQGIFAHGSLREASSEHEVFLDIEDE